MLKELLAQLWMNIHSTEHCSVRLTESVTLDAKDSVLFKNGLFVWCAILTEKASAVLEESSFRSFGGRVIKYPATILTDPRGVATFLGLLDGVDDIVLKTISSSSSEFKAQNLFRDLHCLLSESSPDFWRLTAPVFRVVLSTDLTKDSVSYLRQQFKLLSKLEISRDDMLQELQSEYFEMEDILASEVAVQKARSESYSELVFLIRHMLRDVIEGFTLDARLAKHGPGAVSIPRVKGHVQKYMHMAFDSRIDYLLSKEGAGHMGDYSPMCLLEGDRTSRLIFVPKTWKKLRGISAEPVGLQYFQQAVFRSLSKAISRCPLGRVVNLHDQEVSRDLALEASRDGRLATIDLSSASDSVTLQLVKDIFGTSSLCRWLLATRSTHTLVNNETIRIHKFAPMGSACCFPVECLIFAGAVLATAAKYHKRCPLGDVRVFGDDIICPASLADEVIETLTILGFEVNTSKSFVSGDFRESCGMDAWNGCDVTPLKLKDFSFDFNGSQPCAYEHHSRIVDYLNSLFIRGYTKTRSFLLEKFSSSYVALGGQRVPISRTIVYTSGRPGTLLSPAPTNFHLKDKPLKGYQRYGKEVVAFRPRYRKLSERENSLFDEVAYFNWLMTSSSDSSAPVSYDLRYFLSADVSAPKDTQGMQMIPTLRTVDTIDWVSQEGLLNTLSV